MPSLRTRARRTTGHERSRSDGCRRRHQEKRSYQRRDGLYSACQRSCRAGRGCRLHVHYHGCMKPGEPRKRWSNSIQLNEYAEANGVVVLYPQDKGDARSGRGCWNWSAKRDDKNFDTREGVQLRTVVAMLADIDTAIGRGRAVWNRTSAST